MRSPTQSTELFKSVEVYSGDGLEMADHSVMTLRDSALLHLRSPRTYSFKRVELYLGDDHKMAGFLVDTVNRLQDIVQIPRTEPLGPV